MKPTELHIYDLDGSLYDSPRLLVDRPSWWYSAQSLQGFGPPGFDTKWMLGTVGQGRRSVMDPWARTALLTGRPQHAEMAHIIQAMLRSAELRFDHTQLKPVWPPMSTPRYKAQAVQKWLLRETSIRKVVFYDDLPENLDAVGAVVEHTGRFYVPVLTSGVT